jgi:hypothetical protein
MNTLFSLSYALFGELPNDDDTVAWTFLGFSELSKVNNTQVSSLGFVSQVRETTEKVFSSSNPSQIT